jgi:hypothetical protein
MEIIDADGYNLKDCVDNVVHEMIQLSNSEDVNMINVNQAYELRNRLKDCRHQIESMLKVVYEYLEFYEKEHNPSRNKDTV